MNPIPAATILLLVLVDAQAATYYVATNGLATNSGSLASPMTIQSAIAAAQGGDTIYVRGGTHNEQLAFGTKGGTTGAPITVLNYGTEVPKVRGITMGSFGTTQIVGWITVEGFEAGGIAYHNLHDVVFRRNNLHDGPEQGIIGDGVRITIDRNIVARMGRWALCASDPQWCNQDHGMYLTGTDYTITNNLIVGNMAYGIQVAGYPYDCTQYEGGKYCANWSYPSPEYAGAENFKIYNNTFAFQNYRGGIVVWQRWAVNNIIKNNVFYRNGEKVWGSGSHGISFYYSGTGNIVSNNVFYGPFSQGKAHIEDNGPVPSYTDLGGEQFGADPKFAAPAATGGDFHLTDASIAAIDKGPIFIRPASGPTTTENPGRKAEISTLALLSLGRRRSLPMPRPRR